MRILGRPVHTWLVLFPTALLPMEFVLLLLYRHSGMVSYHHAACYCLYGGVLGGCAALLTGVPDSLAVARHHKAALVTLLYHASLNALVLLAYAVLLGSEMTHVATGTVFGKALVLRGALLLLLLAGNYLGRRLVCHHHVGGTDTR